MAFFERGSSDKRGYSVDGRFSERSSKPVTVMKCITLAENLEPLSLKDETRYLGRRGEAKYFFEEAAKNLERKLKQNEKNTENENIRENVGDRSVTLGSDDLIHSSTDDGLFSSILLAYNNHWKLRTSPEDWWFVVIRKVAIAIDKHSKHEKVRKMFVKHEGWHV